MVCSFPDISMKIHLHTCEKSRCWNSPVSIVVTADKSQLSDSAGLWRRVIRHELPRAEWSQCSYSSSKVPAEPDGNVFYNLVMSPQYLVWDLLKCKSLDVCFTPICMVSVDHSQRVSSLSELTLHGWKLSWGLLTEKSWVKEKDW